MKNLYLFSLFSLLFSINSSGQGENNHWYFGNQAGVNFANGASTIAPTALTNAHWAFRTNDGYSTLSGGCASVSKADGSLLFYTDGHIIFNKLHQIMAGMPTAGGTCNLYLNTYNFDGTKQAAIIFPNPGNVNQYYVISAAPSINLGSPCSEDFGYFYTLIDFTSNPNGQIISFRQPFTWLIEGSQGITVTGNLNGDGFWVLIPVGDTLATSSNNLYAYKVDNTGLNLSSPVTNPLSYNMGNYQVEIKVSTELVSPKICIASSQDSWVKKTRVFSFNRQTGVISAPIFSIDDISVNSTEFSSDGNLLYATIMTSSGEARLVVFDLNNSSTPYRMLSTLSVRGSLQRAVNGEIYFTNFSSSTTSEKLYKIDNQNSFATSSISSSVVNLGLGRDALFGLPQLVPVLGSVNDCLASTTLTLGSPASDMTNSTVPAAQTLRERSDWIKASNVIGFGNSNFQDGVVYHAGNFVELNPGFEATYSSQFSAYIEGCSGNFVYKNGDYNTNDNQTSLIKNKINIYPNPTNSYFTVNYAAEKFNRVIITSLEGRVILNQKIEAANSYQLDISNYKTGVYTLSVQTNEGNTITDKLIKN